MDGLIAELEAIAAADEAYERRRQERKAVATAAFEGWWAKAAYLFTDAAPTDPTRERVLALLAFTAGRDSFEEA